MKNITKVAYHILRKKHALGNKYCPSYVKSKGIVYYMNQYINIIRKLYEE